MGSGRFLDRRGMPAALISVLFCSLIPQTDGALVTACQDRTVTLARTKHQRGKSMAKGEQGPVRPLRP